MNKTLPNTFYRPRITIRNSFTIEYYWEMV